MLKAVAKLRESRVHCGIQSKFVASDLDWQFSSLDTEEFASCSSEIWKARLFIKKTKKIYGFQTM
jgi:hypothetical protein